MRPSRTCTLQKQLNGSRSCSGWRLLGATENAGVENARLENARLENAGVYSMGRKCRSGKCGSR